MAFGRSRVTERDQFFNMMNFMGTPSLFFTLNLTFFHHPLLVVLSGQNVNLNYFLK
jgi:hypothetical protein